MYTVTIAYIETNEHGAFARHITLNDVPWHEIDQYVRSITPLRSVQILSIVVVSED